MSVLMSPLEFAALVGVPVEQVEQRTGEGLLDPDGLGGFEELDLVRWMAIRHWEALGYRSDKLAEAVKAGDARTYFAYALFPSGLRLELEEAAARAGVGADKLRELRTALGFTGDTIAESQLRPLEVLKTFEAAGLPWEAVLEGARVYGDALRRVAETEGRLIHVHIHETVAGCSPRPSSPNWASVKSAASTSPRCCS
jgi:hypothetical protein